MKDKQEIIPEKGAYFFYDTDLEEKRIVYVGISRNIKLRLQQHSNYKNANSASLAYLMAKNERKNIPPKEVRECFEKTKKEKNCRIYYQEKIQQFKVGFVKIENNFEMALFEIYASITLKSKWNSFKTH